jgi:hypothetical protein
MDDMPTIKIAHPTIEGEFMVINEVDFNSALHILFVEGEALDKKGKGKRKPPIVNAALLAQLKPTGEGETEESGDLEPDETTAD